ncbi:S1 family peptidase [Actinomadura flavalba]|uniref:S1 family peptidase n=1 Tax=Actinomadura flavalba TaxID=1120938 RepID=UPI0012DD67E4|nr:S1 family peptidase [Actinomadura flavalba]
MPDVRVDDLPMVELVDLRRIAVAEKISYGEAIDRYGWQTRFEQVADRLERDYPAELAEAALDEDGKGARFSFKGDVPAQAVKLARTLPAKVELKGGTGYSAAELERAMNTAHDSVARRKDVAHVQSAYDASTGVVVVEARRVELAADPDAPEEAQPAMRPATPANPRIKVRLILGNHPDVRPADRAMRGGGRMTYCTAGFTVKKIRGKAKGISTAGHCAVAKRLTYRLHKKDGGTRTTIVRKRRHQGASGDVSWYSRGRFKVARTFYYAWNKKRYADRRAGTPRKGTRICKFGVTSGASCTTVRASNATISTGGRTYRRMVTTNGGGVRPGDSGGPWYYGGTAYGITHGYFEGTKRSVFTPAVSLRKLGVDVYQR